MAKNRTRISDDLRNRKGITIEAIEKIGVSREQQKRLSTLLKNLPAKAEKFQKEIDRLKAEEEETLAEFPVKETAPEVVPPPAPAVSSSPGYGS